MSVHFGFRPGLRPPPQKGLPLYSLITIVRNAADSVERTMESVARQTYPALEYIVVDAGSTDGTVDIIRKYENLITKWCSEPDKGHADGQNKGIRQATGRYIGFVYADDWIDDFFVEKSVNALESRQTDFVFGDLNYYKNGEFLFIGEGDENYQDKISYRAPNMNYPSLSACAYVFEKAGLFDPRYRVAPDYEWLIRVHKAGLKGSYDPRIIYNFSVGGHSTKHINESILEVAQALTQQRGNIIKIWGYAGIKLAFHTVDNFLRAHVSTTTYSRIRALRKAVTG